MMALQETGEQLATGMTLGDGLAIMGAGLGLGLFTSACVSSG